MDFDQEAHLFENISISVVREYLLRRNFLATFKTLTTETSTDPNLKGYTSRAALAKDLHMEQLMQANKQSSRPLRTILEILIKDLLEKIANQHKKKTTTSISVPSSAYPGHPYGKINVKNENLDQKSHLGFAAFGRNGSEIRTGSASAGAETESKISSAAKPSSAELSSQNSFERKEASLFARREELPDVDSLIPKLQKSPPPPLPQIPKNPNLRGNTHTSSNTMPTSGPGSGSGTGSGRPTVQAPEHSSPYTLFTLIQSQEYLLQSKQNMLARAALTEEEDELRLQQSKDNILEQRQQSASASGGSLQFEDIEDFDDGRNFRISRESNFVHLHKSDTPKDNSSYTVTVSSLTPQLLQALKAIIFGPKIVAQEGWLGQGFVFNPKIPFGLVQKKGGPCGVLAAVQAILLRNLMFGSEYMDYQENQDTESWTNFCVTNLADEGTVKKIKLRRGIALAAAFIEILWRCAHAKLSKSNSNSREIADDKVEIEIENIAESQQGAAAICFNHSSTGGIGTEIRTFHALHELKEYIHVNLHRFDCLSVVYSVVLSRGLQNVQNDMDFPKNSPLLGQHGYCTQELVNLLIIGTATSNPFDNQVMLGEQILRGISSQADIGLLSLYEHYDSCRVGSFLKNPKYPLWIVCSESHFSLLFSAELSLAGAGAHSDLLELDTKNPKNFDLYYYDGLALQEWIIKLTVTTGSIDGADKSSTTGPKRVQSIQSAGKSRLNPNNNNCDEEDLIPPLEKCIRTKWQNAVVDWNETEPIL